MTIKTEHLIIGAILMYYLTRNKTGVGYIQNPMVTRFNPGRHDNALYNLGYMGMAGIGSMSMTYNVPQNPVYPFFTGQPGGQGIGSVFNAQGWKHSPQNDLEVYVSPNEWNGYDRLPFPAYAAGVKRIG